MSVLSKVGRHVVPLQHFSDYLIDLLFVVRRDWRINCHPVEEFHVGLQVERGLNLVEPIELFILRPKRVAHQRLSYRTSKPLRIRVNQFERHRRQFHLLLLRHLLELSTVVTIVAADDKVQVLIGERRRVIGSNELHAACCTILNQLFVRFEGNDTSVNFLNGANVVEGEPRISYETYDYSHAQAFGP